MKTNFFDLHLKLVMNGEYTAARWLYKTVIRKNKPSLVSVAVTCNEAWITGAYIRDFDGYFIYLAY